MKWLHDLHFHIPDDVQVIGYDDIPLAKLFYPSLTTIEQPAYEIGKQAALGLINQLEHNDVTTKVVLDVDVIHRIYKEEEIMTSIYVVGSLSIDLVVSTNKVPSKGETVLGESFLQHLVEKGKPSVAAARLGDDVYMVGRIGDDFGNQILQT